MQVKLSAAPNFRDFGGLPTRDGRRVRLGWLYRSEALDTLTDADVEALHALGIRTVCDLRSGRERKEYPSRLPPGGFAELLTAADGVDAGAADIATVLRRAMDANAARATAYMARTYASFPEQFAPVLKELFARLEQGQGPVLIHCAAGKDRTGFVCAMLHHVLGVTPEAILADYLLSDEHFGAARILAIVQRHMGAAPLAELIDPLRVHAKYLESTINGVEAAHGSVDGYLETLAGLTQERRESLRERLIEDASG